MTQQGMARLYKSMVKTSSFIACNPVEIRLGAADEPDLRITAIPFLFKVVK